MPRPGRPRRANAVRKNGRTVSTDDTAILPDTLRQRAAAGGQTFDGSSAMRHELCQARAGSAIGILRRLNPQGFTERDARLLAELRKLWVHYLRLADAPSPTVQAQALGQPSGPQFDPTAAAWKRAKEQMERVRWAISLHRNKILLTYILEVICLEDVVPYSMTLPASMLGKLSAGAVMWSALMDGCRILRRNWKDPE